MTRRKAQLLIEKGLLDEEVLHIFFSRVRDRRVDLGLSQVEAGEKMGYSHVMFGRLENGSFPRNPARVVQLCEVLKTTLDYLFGLTDDPTPPAPRKK